MRLIDCRNFIQGAETLRTLYIQLCDIYLGQLYQDNSIALKQILERYSMKDIRDAFRNISVDNQGYLFISDKSRYSMLMRYLEFGGENIKPTHILSLAKHKLYKSLSNERR